MGQYGFNKKKCNRSLKRIGFSLERDRGGKHDRYVPSNEILNNCQTPKEQQPPFIMIPRGSKFKGQYYVVKELKALGGQELLDKFLVNL